VCWQKFFAVQEKKFLQRRHVLLAAENAGGYHQKIFGAGFFIIGPNKTSSTQCGQYRGTHFISCMLVGLPKYVILYI